MISYATGFILGSGFDSWDFIPLFPIQNHTLPEVYYLPIETHEGKLPESKQDCTEAGGIN